MRLRVIALLVAPVVATACLGEARADSRRAVRLSSGESDTVVVNSLWPTVLPLRALDSEGHVVAGAAIQYAWTGGAPLPVSPTGEVHCSGTADAVVRATLAELTTRIVLLCRPVTTVRLDGPIQFILGDPLLNRPQGFSIHAYGPDGRSVNQIAGVLMLKDTTIAVIRGQMIFPRARGITTASTHIGDGDGGIGVHVYQRVPRLDAIDTALRVPPPKRLFAIPLDLASGDFRRQRLPPGDWMLTMLPEDDNSAGRIRLRIDGAPCQSHFLGTMRRWGCRVGTGVSVIVYRPMVSGAVSSASGPRYLLVRWLFN